MLLRINFLSESFSQNILKSNVGLCQACPFLFMALLFSVSLSVIHHPVVQLDLLAVVVDAHDAVNARGHGHHESSRRLVHLLSGLGRHGAVQDTVRPSLSATAMFRIQEGVFICGCVPRRLHFFPCLHKWSISHQVLKTFKFSVASRFFLLLSNICP